MKKYLKKKNQLKYEKLLVSLKIYNYFKMSKESISQEFRLKNMDETRNYFLEEVERNELTSNKPKNGLYNLKLYWALSYFSFCGYWMYFSSAFASLLGIPIEIMSSEIGLKICALTTRRI